MEPESRLGSKLVGFKNRLMKPSSTPASKAPSGSMDPYMLTQASAAPPAAHSGPSPSPLDFAYDFGALAQDRQEARQATAMEHATASGTQHPTTQHPTAGSNASVSVLHTRRMLFLGYLEQPASATCHLHKADLIVHRHTLTSQRSHHLPVQPMQSSDIS